MKRILKAKTAWVVDSNSGIWTRYDDVTIVEEVQEETQLFVNPPTMTIRDGKHLTEIIDSLTNRART